MENLTTLDPIILPANYGLSVSEMTEIYPNPNWAIKTYDVFERATARSTLQILGANGKISLPIPVKKYLKGTPTSAIKIDYLQKWQNQHWRSIQSAYGKSPFFEYYRTELEKLFLQKPDLLIEFTIPIIKWIHRQYFPKGNFSVIMAQDEQKFQPINHSILSMNWKKGTEKQERQYTQVFGQEFVTGLSVLDALFCEGPNFGN